MTRVPTIALAASIPSAASRRYIHRLARPVTCIASTNTKRFATTTLHSFQQRCHISGKTGLKASESVSSSSAILPGNTNARSISAIAQRLPSEAETKTSHRFREFELENRVFIVTGGARGLGLTLAEALVEAGGHVYCVDRLPEPAPEYYETEKRVGQFGGSIHYRQVDVQDAVGLDASVAEIANHHQRLDGLIAAAGVQYVSSALEYPSEKIGEMMDINFGGVYRSAVSCCRQMEKYGCVGSIVLVGSMSAFIANKGLRTSVYNCSKAAVVQLGRSLAMEWSSKGIRVNVLCPGNIVTPMVKKNFEDEPHLKELWESENMMKRLSTPEEYRGAALFMLSDASSFMTGSSLIIDGGYTAW
ncbi:hypothetical protein MBLNU13_g02614t1 [Cladosporium sp. NU13]